MITTINGYTKVFIGNLIERARKVQQQAAGQLPTPPPDANGASGPDSRPGTSSSTDQKLQLPSSIETVDDIFASPTTTQVGSSQSTLRGTQGRAPPRWKEKLGPLQPDHVREALRRNKRDGEGGGTGAAAMSLGLGNPGSSTARVGGRKLFG